jgi:hypothetical protein
MRPLVRTLILAAAVAVVGFALARYGSSKSTASPPPLDRQASVANFKLNYPSGWSVRPSTVVPLVPLGDVITLGSDQSQDSRLVIGTQQTTAPGALPPRLAAALPPSTRPQVVSLGGRHFLRYLNLTPQGQNVAESIYALPTSAGTITAVCSAPTFTERFTGNCERILTTLKPTAGDVTSVTVDPGYALALNRILGPLNQTRRTDGPGLRSTKVSDRVHAASALAKAHAEAATAASHISAGNVSAANQALVTALSQNASAYKALALAAAQQNVPAYGRAETALSGAGSGLDAAYEQLRRLGYQVS